jgi:hypothetical protein
VLTAIPPGRGYNLGIPIGGSAQLVRPGLGDRNSGLGIKQIALRPGKQHRYGAPQPITVGADVNAALNSRIG